LNFHLARGLGTGLGPGDEVVVTELDHHANVAPWQGLVRERGITLRTVRMNPETAQLDWEDLTRTLNARTKVLAIGAASNALGTINDVKAAARVAHECGATVVVDAVHYAPHQLVDVAELECDFLLCSAYKFHGPHIGVLYGRRGLLEVINVPKLEPAPDTAPERVETGTQNHEGIVGAAAAIEFLAGLTTGATRRERLQSTFEALHGRSRALVDQLWEGLRLIPGIQLFGPPPDAVRTPTVAFIAKGKPAKEIALGLAAEGVFVSHGDFYASTAVARLGHAGDGLVRVGCACYSTDKEVARLIDGVKLIAG
jgi:cysteine desulfurase family protein (TIGR01976 family)